MKMMNKTTLAVALAATMGVYLPEVGAVVKLNETPLTTGPALATNAISVGGAVVLAAEESGESTMAVHSYYASSTPYTRFDGDLSVLIPVPAGYSVAGTKTLFVRVTLTGGAKFAAEPKLICPNQLSGAATLASEIGSFVSIGVGTDKQHLASAGDTTTDVLAASGLFSVPTIAALGKTTATFNIVSGLTTTQSGCIVTFTHSGNAAGFIPAYTVTTRGDVGMSVEAGYIQGAVAVTSVVSGVFMTFKTALKAVITATEVVAPGSTVVSPVVTIDVKQASKKFVDDAGTVALGATLGGIKVVSAYDSTKIRLASSASKFADIVALAPYIMATATVTIAGPLVAGVKSVGLYRGTECTNVSIVPLATPSTTTGGGNVVLNNIPVDSAVNGLNICAEIDGNTTLNNGQLTAVLTGGGKTNFTPDLGAETNIANVGINGARLRVLNIPASNNADQVFIRFYNTSSQDTIVRGTLYGQDGKMIGSDNMMLFNPLKANSVGILDATKLATIAGGGTTPVAAWTGRAWLLVQAELDKDSFKVTGLVRTPTGVLVNLSSDATN